MSVNSDASSASSVRPLCYCGVAARVRYILGLIPLPPESGMTVKIIRYFLKLILCYTLFASR